MVPARRGHDGRFQVDGENVLAPKETQYAVFNKLMPILEAARGRKLVIVPPLPRYLENSCCEDKEHIPNINKASYKEDLEASVLSCKTNLKDFAFRKGIRMCRVISPWQVLRDVQDTWEDPVHLKKGGYMEIARMTEDAGRELGKKKRPEEGLHGGSKRKRDQSGDRHGLGNQSSLGGHSDEKPQGQNREYGGWRGDQGSQGNGGHYRNYQQRGRSARGGWRIGGGWRW